MTSTHTAGLTGRALGEAVIEQVLSHPESHDQGDVACGTTACIAGWTVALHRGLQTGVGVLEDRYGDSRVAWPQGMADTLTYASALLGLDRREFDWAVYGEQNRDEAITNLKHLLDAAGPQLS